MEDMTIGIVGDNGNIKDFKIDGEILTGLYIAHDSKKVQENCKVFEIEVQSEDKNSIAVKISLRHEMGILTLKHDEKNQIQYLVSRDLDIYQLMGIPDDEIPKETKQQIMQTLSITTNSKMGDLFM